MSARKPAELKVLEGNRGKQRLPNTPKAPPLLADPPAELGPRGRKLWERVCNAFEAPIVLESDYSALLALCQSWELQQAAYVDLQARGVIVESSRADRELVRNPSCMIWSAAAERVHRGLVAFGLTPAARAAFDVPKEEPKNPVLEIAEADRRPGRR
jgi:P27 family predicted phage terminase small subunit